VPCILKLKRQATFSERSTVFRNKLKRMQYPSPRKPTDRFNVLGTIGKTFCNSSMLCLTRFTGGCWLSGSILLNHPLHHSQVRLKRLHHHQHRLMTGETDISPLYTKQHYYITVNTLITILTLAVSVECCFLAQLVHRSRLMVTIEILSDCVQFLHHPRHHVSRSCNRLHLKCVSPAVFCGRNSRCLKLGSRNVAI